MLPFVLGTSIFFLKKFGHVFEHAIFGLSKCIVFLCCFRMVMPGLKNVLDRSRKWLCYREHILKSPYFIVLEVQSERESESQRSGMARGGRSPFLASCM